MNGDSYSSRGDGGRHGSSRDHYSSRSSRDDHRGGGDRDRGERRRRSRSPGHRSSRREYGDVDTYSSSRDHREREREDRYRDRREGGGREDRDWNRDRGPPPRRERMHDDRPPRRERDLFDDRDGGRGGRGGRGDRDGPGGRGAEKRKSVTPPPKPKEPTPDLTDVPSILEKRRRLTQWDIKPPGYENVTAEQAKLSGMFPLPGAPRPQPMDPSRLQAFMNQPSGSASNAALQTSNAKQSKRLFIYNLPANADDGSIVELFNLHLNGLNVVSSTDPCVSCQISKDRSLALVDFKSAEDATMALALDGILSEDEPATNGSANGSTGGLSIRRPKDYIVPSVTDDAAQEEGVVSQIVRDSQNKISITNIPYDLTDDQVNELLSSFGDLKSFILVKDNSTGVSKGVAFCEFNDPSTTSVAVEGLNGTELGSRQLKVQRASIGATQAGGAEMGVGAMSLLAGTTSSDLEQGRVLQLLNMVTAEELMDNDEYAEICADVKEECERFGKVEEMKVPRPSGGSRQSTGVGRIFVKYDTPESAQKALKALAGRKFADRTVVVTFFGEEYFDLNAW